MLQKLLSFKYVPFLIIAAGLIFRLLEYTANRSLWLDEAKLAVNIVDTPFHRLNEYLTYHSQAAPVGFLYIEKICIEIFGNYDYILRLFPLFAGCLSLFIIYFLSRRVLSGFAPLVITSFFAVSDRLIYFSSEVKQYSTDVLATLIFLFVFVKTKQKPDKKGFIVLGITGAIVLWFSYQVLFALSAAGLALVLYYLMEKDFKKFKQISISFSFWVISFAILWKFSISNVASNSEHFINYWAEYFMPLPPWNNLEWFPATFNKTLEYTLGINKPVLSAILMGIGSYHLFINKRSLAVLLIFTILIVLIASSLKLYPFGVRLVLFLAPVILLLLVSGIYHIYLLLKNYNRHFAHMFYFVIVIVLIYAPVTKTAYHIKKPRYREETKPIFSYLERRIQSSDIVYVYSGASPAVKYYKQHYDFNNAKFIEGQYSRRNYVGYRKDLKKLISSERVWVIFSHIHLDDNEEVILTEMLDSIGSKLEYYKSIGASIYLYNLKKQ